MLDGSSTLFPRSRYTWPVTPPIIPQSYWKLWRQALRRCFVQPNQHPTRLHQPLGSWLHTPSDWKALFSPSTQCLYIQQGLNYAIWLQVPTCTCSQRFQSSTLSTQTPPRDTVPCMYFHRGTYLQLTGIGTLLPVSPETSTDHPTSNSYPLAISGHLFKLRFWMTASIWHRASKQVTLQP